MAHRQAGGVGRRFLELETWTLEDLTQKALDGELAPAVGVDAFVARIDERLAMASCGVAPVLVGPPGIGKSAIIRELVRRSTIGRGSHLLRESRVMRVSLRRVAGLLGVEQSPRELMELLLERLRTAHPPRVLYIEDLHHAHTLGWGPAISAFLARNELPVLLEARDAELEDLLSRDSALAGQLMPIVVPEPGPAALAGILAAQVQRREDLRVEPSALRTAAGLVCRFPGEDGSPRRGIALLEHAMDFAGPSASGSVGVREVVLCFSRLTGIPIRVLDGRLPLDLQAMRERFAAWLPGQEDAVSALTDTVALIKSGLARPDRPLGSLLFTGPQDGEAGRAAELLSQVVFGAADRLIQIDLAHHGGPAGVTELLGDPEASRRSVRRGLLGQELSAVPIGVLHLQHLERADPHFVVQLAEAVERGQFVDGTGTLHRLSGVLVVVSCEHAAASDLRRLATRTTAPVASAPSELVRAVDRVVALLPPARPQVLSLLERSIEAVGSRLARSLPGLELRLSADAVDWLLGHAEDPENADRNLEALVEASVTPAVAAWLVARPREEIGCVVLELASGRLVARGPAEVSQAVPVVAEKRAAAEAPVQHGGAPLHAAMPARSD